MANYIIPIFLIVLFLFSSITNINAYDGFIQGGKQAVTLCVNTFPYLVAIFVAVELFKLSGLSVYISTLMSPVFTFLGIPSELVEFLVIRPFTGSGSLALFSDIIATYGVDSFIVKCTAVIMSCSETVFYIVAVYFSTVKIKKLRPTIFLALLSCFIGSIIACAVCRII